MFNALIKKETVNLIDAYIQAISPLLPEEQINEFKTVMSEPQTMVLISSIIDIYSRHLKPETMEFMYKQLLDSKPAMKDIFENMENIIPEISALIHKIESGVESQVEA
jgi:ABC-type histidine transport system ATPase subunit